MTKQALRELYQTKRNALDARERLRLDDLLLIQFQQFDYGEIGTLLSYWPMAHTAEPNTLLFTGYLRHMIPGLVMGYPVTDKVAKKMTALAINEETLYQTDKWGLTEPKEGAVIPAGQIDLVLVPLLAFDQQGYRVGYGKGFYDRFLVQCRKDTVKIGFSYFGPEEKITDTDQFDVPLSYCITPQHIYEF